MTRASARPIASSANLGLLVGLRSRRHLDELLIRIAHDHPDAKVVDRKLVLRTSKVHGRILDDEGRSTRVVPVDPWAALQV
ncbi:hypothetical protein [Saccharopolyspora sp. NPDC049426]|uniref:hypothetical protein n=1 Tax=Saccharopolyspora sp. NPDC049426 TaxID=3155652 RepID=UPI00342470A8